MVELLSYPTEHLPPIWKWQVLSFLRAIWPDGFVGDNRWRDWITKPDDHPHSFILVERELMMRFISPKGQRARPSFERGQLYFGSDSTW